MKKISQEREEKRVLRYPPTQ